MLHRFQKLKRQIVLPPAKCLNRMCRHLPLWICCENSVKQIGAPMSDLETHNPNPIFRGTVQNATYKDQSIVGHRDNPMIGALPIIRSASEIASLLASYPELQPDGSTMPAEVRTHLIMDVLHFFQPLPVHIDLEQRVSRVLRDGYRSRDPRKKEFWLDLDQNVETILKCGGIPYRSSNTNGFSI